MALVDSDLLEAGGYLEVNSEAGKSIGKRFRSLQQNNILKTYNLIS
jgi:hypothetical protein